IHSHGNDPGMDIIDRIWPGDNPSIHDRHQIMKAVKHELGPAGRDLNFNAYADNRSLFRYDMHTLPSEISDQSIGTSTLFAAWNAAIYVAQVEDDRLGEVVADGRYLESTRDVLREHGALWFYDESYVISRRREGMTWLPSLPRSTIAPIGSKRSPISWPASRSKRRGHPPTTSPLWPTSLQPAPAFTSARCRGGPCTRRSTPRRDCARQASSRCRTLPCAALPARPSLMIFSPASRPSPPAP